MEGSDAEMISKKRLFHHFCNVFNIAITWNYSLIRKVFLGNTLHTLSIIGQFAGWKNNLEIFIEFVDL